MKKILYFIMILAAVFTALTLTACGKKNNDDSTESSSIPFVSDFTCNYYDVNDNIISDKSTVFEPDDEIRVKIDFTLSNKAYAAGKRKFTIKFMPTVGFDGRIQYANSSSTSDKNFTATYTVDDRNAKKCEVEARIIFRFSRGSLNVSYSYDGEEFSDVIRTPLNNDKTLSFKYDLNTDGYKVSKDPESGEWLDKASELTFPDSFAGKPVTIIDSAIFSGCVDLKSISIPSSVTYMEDYNAFDNCPIEVASISAEMVRYMPKSTLKRVKIVGNGTIGWYDSSYNNSYGTFKKYVNLTSVELPYDIGGIVNNAFEGCDKLQYNEYGGARYLGNAKNPYVALVSVTSRDLSCIDVHKDTKVICDNAFEYCSNLKEITLYNGLRIIGMNAFMHCSKLESITIPDSITKVDDAFWGCDLKYNEYGNAYYLGNEKNPYVVLMTTFGATSVRMNASTKTIRSGIFNKNENLTSVTIDGVTHINEGMFKDCKNLTDVTISDKVTSIGAEAFCDCVSLKNITIPRGITSIDDKVFYRCSGLTSITIPKGVTNIGASSFAACSSLTSITIPEGVTSIGFGAFDYCKSLASVTIPDSVTEVGTSVFNNCDNLRYNEYGNSYYLGNEKNPYHALIAAVNTSVTSVDINENTKVIANYAFAKRTELVNITIPGSVKHIGRSAFMDCSGLRDVIISEGVTTIGDYVFTSCQFLNVTIPKSVTSFGSAIFGNENYISITYGGSVKEWLNLAFNNGVVAADDTMSVAVQCTDELIRFVFY